jgi:SAM-dependent methyltransferase
VATFAAAKAFLRPLYYWTFRFQLRARVWLADHRPQKAPAAGPSLPPALLRYRVCESLSAETFLRIGLGCAIRIEQQVQGMGCGLAGRVLDFGCGCGRILGWLAQRHPGTHFCGTDVDADAIEWCRRNIPVAAFFLNAPQPPLPFDSAYFDVVYCFSIFTHLDERAGDAWLSELKRVIKPGGILILTVHGERSSRRLDKKAAALLRRDGFLHCRSHKLRGIVPDWYNTSFHSRAFIVDRLEALFADVRYTVVPDGTQDLVTARLP